MGSLGDYELGRVLGEGATGLVHEATERSTGRQVAVKILHADLTRTETVRRSVAQDLSAVAQLRSPHAVLCHGCGVVGERVVLAFELLQGETLRARIERGRLSWPEAVTIAIQVGTALQAAHELAPPLLHRDLKPEAIVLTPHGAKVTDFGLAKVLGSVGQTTTATFGNIRYMSPEQIDAWGIDERSDVYCLGLVLYEMVVGRHSVSGTSPRELLNAQCTLPPPAFPPEVVASTPPDLERVVRHLLEKSKDARPKSAADAVRLLQSVLHGQPVTIAASTAPTENLRSAMVVPARPSVPLTAKTKPVVPIVLGSVAALALLAVGAGYVLLRETSSPAPVLARAEATAPSAAPESTAPLEPPSATRAAAPPSPPEPTPSAPDPTRSRPAPLTTPAPAAEPDPQVSAVEAPVQNATVEADGDETGEDAEEPEDSDALPSADEAAIAMLVGEHKCAIHWISKRGTCVITREGDVLKIKGSQGSSGDFFKISGKVRVLSDRTFMVDGTLDSRVSSCCGRRTISGTFKFKRNGSRRYWRLQDPMRSKICHPTKVCMYYVDIFMK